MNSFDIYKEYINTYENAISIMWKVFRKKEFIDVILKDHTKKKWPIVWVRNYAFIANLFPEKARKIEKLYDLIQINNHNNRDEFGEFIEFSYKNYKCKFYGIIEAGRIINGDIEGVFFIENYDFLEPFEGNTVIDIGANIGDSTIYFALNKARRIISLEPFPFPYKFAKLNIAANNVKNKIELLNAGYGKDFEVKVKNKKSKVDDILELSNDGKKINTYSLATLINMFGLNDDSDLLLKMDCEGCEYNLLDEPVDVLRKFKRIALEFHYGYINLESKLEKAGFSVHHGKVLRSGCSEPSLKKMALANKDLTIGMIYAERRTI